jgi:glycosyltransferase involved in cell wall biosynthesis
LIMKFIVLAESLRTGDAVGNNVVQEYLSLKSSGYQAFIFASNFDRCFTPYLISRRKLLKYLAETETVLIYHHSIFWEAGERIINSTACPIYLRYHNITPDIFFKGYSDLFVGLSRAGRQQTKKFIAGGKIHHYIADSAFNSMELISDGVSPTNISILAPLHKIHEFDDAKVNQVLLDTLIDGRINILSVGRVVPNKGHHHAIEAANRYRNMYGDEFCLNIVGGMDPNFKQYTQELEDLVTRYNLSDRVVFRGKVSFDDLHTYYVASHVLLLMSEHEGFCLPILEAQHHRLPVLPLDRGAVRDTLGDEQLLFPDCDYDLIASAIHIVSTDNNVRNYLADSGCRNLLKYQSRLLSERLIRIVNEHS